MGYQPRRKSPRAGRGYGKFLREKTRDKKQFSRSQIRQFEEEKQVLTEKEIAEITLKRLHTLGNQKFGSSPFSEHFDRWIANVDAVLGEFKAHPTIGADETFLQETQDALAIIKRQLEDRRCGEELVTQEAEELSKFRTQLKTINIDYAAKALTVKVRKRKEINRLNRVIEALKREQDDVIKMKTGFFHLTSKKKREQKEAQIVQKLSDRQTELELAMLDFSAEQKDLKDSYDTKREPVLKEIKNLQKTIGVAELDGSLEERWFACEALIDAVNSFLQRKAASNQINS